MAKGTQRSGNNITGVSGAEHGAKQNAASMQRAAGKAGQANYEFGSQGTGQSSGVQFSGTNITGVSGAQDARQRNNASMKRASRETNP